MSKCISWGNVIALFGVILLMWCLSLGELSKERAQAAAAVIMLVTSWTVCDIICRYLTLRGKDR